MTNPLFNLIDSKINNMKTIHYNNETNDKYNKAEIEYFKDVKRFLIEKHGDDWFDCFEDYVACM